jgi:rhodanese-related sulfurtransferase
LAKLKTIVAAIVQRLFYEKKIPAPLPSTLNPEYGEMLSRLLTFKVPIISVEKLQSKTNKVHIFDTRSWEEFQLSHIPGAVFLDFKDFDKTLLDEIPKNAELVLYCSVGYRSELVGKKLIQLGFSNTYNLYGGIFEWSNQGLPLFDSTEKTTPRLHTYNHTWSKWVEESNTIEKTW